MSLIATIQKLCTPSYIYLVMSIIAMVLMIFQNAGNTNKYCIGEYECSVNNTATIFIVKACYIVFWTFVLNAICKAGYKGVSWFLVLIPFILMAIFIGVFMLSKGISN
jgi:hypothetical protein